MAGIIKASGKRGKNLDSGHVAFNFDDMSDKAKAYLDTVRQDAGKIVTTAKGQADQVRSQAEQKGQQAAVQAAEQTVQTKVAEQMQSVLPAMQQAIEAIIHAKQAWLRQWEKSAVTVAAAIAERIVRRELSQTPQITVELVREALELAAGNDSVKVHLNPCDFDALGNEVKQLADRLSKLAPSDIISDPQVEQGGCVVKTEFGEIDQQIKSQLKRIEQELA